jgi:very-short-patch-repair endonuclease
MVRPLPGRRRDVHEVAMENHGVITKEDLDGCGLPRSTITRWCQTERLVRVAPRTYLLVDLADEHSYLAAVEAACPSAVVSHRAAGELLGLDGITEPFPEFTVQGSPPSIRWAYFHRSRDMQPFDVVEVDGLRCTDATRTLCDLGAVEDALAVERALESALRRGLTSLPRLRWRSELLARPGRSGPGVLRQVLGERQAGAAPTGSELETRFVQCLREGDVPDPERQHVVRLRSGGNAHLDFAWPAPRLFAELDGAGSHDGWEARRRDMRRQTAVVALGWRPLRFTWDEVVNDPDGTASAVRLALQSAAREEGA